MILSIKFHEILFISSRATFVTKFLLHTYRHTETERHFPDIVKSCSGHPKTCQSIKNQKLKIFTILVLFSIFTEKSKNARLLRKKGILKFSQEFHINVNSIKVIQTFIGLCNFLCKFHSFN